MRGTDDRTDGSDRVLADQWIVAVQRPFRRVQPTGEIWMTFDLDRRTPPEIEHPDRYNTVLVAGSDECLLHVLEELREP